MERRRFVAGATLALAVPFAGCLSRIDRPGSSHGTEELPVRFWLKEISLSSSTRESLNPIVFEELPTGEQEIITTAIEKGEYTVEQGSEPAALESLRDRIEQRTGNGETLEAYLRRADSDYRIGFVDGDHIIAHPDH